MMLALIAIAILGVEPIPFTISPQSVFQIEYRDLPASVIQKPVQPKLPSNVTVFDARPTLHFTTAPFPCPPCEDFKRQDWSAFNLKFEPHFTPQHYPWIEWQGSDGKWWYLPQWNGKSSFLETWKRTQSNVASQPVQQSSPSMISRNHWPAMTGYNPRWTWPGNLRSHLLNVHGVTEAMSLSHEQACAVHDALHEGYNLNQIRAKFCR